MRVALSSITLFKKQKVKCCLLQILSALLLFIIHVDAKRDLMAMRALQQTTPLKIRSCPSILTYLDQLLIDRCRFMYNNRLSCYATKMQSLSRTQIQLVSYTGGDRRMIMVYTRYGLALKAPSIICSRRQFQILPLFQK